MQELQNKKILVVDDEPELLRMLKDALLHEGFYQVYTASDSKHALDIAGSQNIALFVLDVNLPDGSGFELLQNIRNFSQAPAIFLTARGEDGDRLRGLGIGADDYIVKPFLMKELILRITAVLKRTYQINNGVSVCKLSGRVINFETASVKAEGREANFTAKEFILLKKLFENKNKIVTNDTLCMAAWGDDYYGYENTLMVHIRRLREKIEPDPGSPRHIITVKGIGYKLVTDDE